MTFCRSAWMVATLLSLACPVQRISAGTPAPAAAASAAEFEQRRLAVAEQSIYFDRGETAVDDEQSTAVIDHMHIAEDFPADRIRLEGHCDEREAASGGPTLGLKRAESVKRQMMLLGIAAGRIEPVSLCEVRPPVACHDEACWGKERRVEVVHLWH